MEPKTLPEIRRVYDDFKPTTKWAQEEGSDSLLVFVPGFKIEEMKVQITSNRNIRVMGERQVGGNKWSRFLEEFPISSNHETKKVTARFENGILFVKLPKVNVPAQPPPPPLEEAEKPTPEIPKPPQPETEPQQPQKIDQKEETVKTETTTKQTVKKTYEKERTTAVKMPDEKPNGESSRADDLNSGSDAASQRKKNEGHSEEEKVTSKERQTVGDSVNDEKKQKEENGCGDRSNQQNPEINKQIPEIYKQVIADYVPKVKKPGNLVNLVLALLLVLVLILYAKNAITSTEKTN